MKRKKKSTRKLAVIAADKYFSLYIRAKSYIEHGALCVFCNKSPIGHCFHFFSRVAYSTRWDELNCVASCRGCNMRMEYEAYPFYKWFIDEHGQFALDQLNRKHHTITKFSTADIQDIADKYKKLYEELEPKP